jgi:hypothetical protein
MTTRVDNLKAWAGLLVAAVSAAIALSLIGVALYADTAIAATPTRATIEATSLTVPAQSTGETFAVCPGAKRALGGGVVQSGPAANSYVQSSGPLDATGITSETNDGDIAKQWYASVENLAGAQRVFKVFAICE